MKVSEKTKISALIKEDKAVIDVIASINSHFKKLKNPVLHAAGDTRIGNHFLHIQQNSDVPTQATAP